MDMCLMKLDEENKTLERTLIMNDNFFDDGCDENDEEAEYMNWAMKRGRSER